MTSIGTIQRPGGRAAARPRRVRRALAGCLAAAGLAACAHAPQEPAGPTAEIRAAVADPDRSEADRKTDLRRHPEQLLAFIGVRPGMKVLDVGAGAGYSTELLARVVGSGGVVYGQDAPGAAMGRAGTAFGERLNKAAMRNVVRVQRDFADPVPPEVTGLDLVTVLFAYHDTAYMPVDRPAMRRRLFEALKPGGVLVVADHAARPGDGAGVAKSLHRIEEDLVVREFEGSGFRLAATGDFLRHPEDPRTAIVFRSETPVDEFVLKFVKPQQ